MKNMKMYIYAVIILIIVIAFFISKINRTSLIISNSSNRELHNVTIHYGHNEKSAVGLIPAHSTRNVVLPDFSSETEIVISSEELSWRGGYLEKGQKGQIMISDDKEVEFEIVN